MGKEKWYAMKDLQWKNQRESAEAAAWLSGPSAGTTPGAA